MAACAGWRAGDESWMSRLVHWTDSNGVKMLSDPLEDLNAMNEAEKVIPDELWPIYRDLLENLAFQSRDLKARYFKPQCCTAAQRAEALLRALGKWEND